MASLFTRISSNTYKVTRSGYVTNKTHAKENYQRYTNHQSKMRQINKTMTGIEIEERNKRSTIRVKNYHNYQ